MKKKHFIIFVVIIAVAGLCWLWFNKKEASAPSGPAQNNASSEEKIAPGEPAPTFDKAQYSLTDPASIWVVANKHRPLSPPSYAPSDLVVPNIPLSYNITAMEKQLRKEPAAELEKMVAAASKENIKLNLQSGYRSYSFQVSLYNRYVQQQGKAVADTQSARPGYSEHQTGFAADLGSIGNTSCDVEACFADTPEGKWLAGNAYRYGFVIRYPKGMDSTTGYIYEPWHIRYIGTSLAAELHGRGIATLEEFFGLEKAPSYN